MKHIALTSLLVLASLVLPTTSFAHEYTTDGVVNASIHATPETPDEQKQTTLMFTIDDKSHKFAINNCDCELTIEEPGKLPYTQKISTPTETTGGLYSVMVPFTFPHGGTYDVTFVGNPSKPNAFQPFKLHWDFKVNGKSANSMVVKQHAISNPYLPYEIAGAIIVVIGGVFAFRKRLFK